jgi:putative hemolysin
LSLGGELLVILALVLLNAVFSGAEIALLAVRKTRLRELVAGGDRAARAVQALRQRPERLLATIQIGITVVSASAAAFGGSSMAGHLEEILVRDASVSPRVAGPLSFGLVVAFVSYVSIVLGELVPKSLALRAAERYSLWMARPLLALAWLMRPLVWFLTGSSNLILRVFRDSTTFTEARLSPDELQQLVDEAARVGSLDARIGDMASRCFDLAELTVQQVMLPRHKIVAIRRGATADDVLQHVTEEEHSRFPVYDGTLDKIVGYILARDVLALAREPQLLVLEDLLRPVFFVAETTPAVDALRELQKRRLQIAVVHDEHGSVAGLVTIEDILEEIVGEIMGENDVPDVLIRREADPARAVVQGHTPIREINRELGVDLPEGDNWSTIAGLCTHLAGWIPSVGTRVTCEDGTILEVVDASPSRVRSVRVIRPPRPSPGE